jgi:nucleoside-diphosphate-sugar epimerase
LIAVTGASGYIGAHCVAYALKYDSTVVAISTQAARTSTTRVSTALRWQQVDAYVSLSVEDWIERFRGVRAVIHTAARVHQARVTSDDDSMMRDNAQLTARVARAASLAGVERFVFLSSAAVYGDVGLSEPFSLSSPMNPMSAYARSKIAAEEVLREIAGESDMRIAILRPPVVYGDGAPGNVARLARAIARGVPMPFASIENRRSLVSVATVAGCALWCVNRRDESTDKVCVWLLTDRMPISTRSIVVSLARGMGRSPRLLPVPKLLLKAGLSLIGSGRVASQLLDDWVLDGTALQRAGFIDQMDSEIGLELMGRSYNRV